MESTALERHRLERLLDASRLLNSTLQVSELAEIVLRIVRDEVPVDRCTLFVVDSGRNVLLSVVAQEIEPFEIRMPVGKGLAGTVAATGEMIDVADAYDDPRFEPQIDEQLGYRTKDVLCLPVVNRDGVLIGVLQLLNRTRPFNDSDREFLATMCTYIGLALQNAGVYRELLEKRDLERDLRILSGRLAQAEKSSLLNELAAGIIHEMRNPLTIALGQCALLYESHPSSTVIETRADKIKESIERAVNIAQTFLRSARDGKREDAPTHLNQLITQTVDLLEFEVRRHSVSLDLKLEDLPISVMDAGAIQQVLVNLLKNAMDAAAEEGSKGSILVRSRHDETANVITVAITDNGPGIPPDAQPRIFDPLFTTKSAGTGLGLAVCKRIVHQHHGTISFSSESGKGTTFLIELPVLSAMLKGTGR